MQFLSDDDLTKYLIRTIGRASVIADNEARDVHIKQALDEMDGSIHFVPSYTSMRNLMRFLNMISHPKPFLPADIVTFLSAYAEIGTAQNILHNKFCNKLTMYGACKLVSINGLLDCGYFAIYDEFEMMIPQKHIRGAPITILQIVQIRDFSSNIWRNLIKFLAREGKIHVSMVILAYFVRNYANDVDLLYILNHYCIFRDDGNILFRARMPTLIRYLRFFKQSDTTDNNYWSLINILDDAITPVYHGERPTLGWHSYNAGGNEAPMTSAAPSASSTPSVAKNLTPKRIKFAAIKASQDAPPNTDEESTSESSTTDDTGSDFILDEAKEKDMKKRILRRKARKAPKRAQSVAKGEGDSRRAVLKVPDLNVEWKDGEIILEDSDTGSDTDSDSSAAEKQ